MPLWDEDEVFCLAPCLAALRHKATLQRNHRSVPSPEAFFESLVVGSIFGKTKEPQEVAGVEKANLVILWATHRGKESRQEDRDQAVLAEGYSEFWVRDELNEVGAIPSGVERFFKPSQRNPANDQRT